MDTVQSVIDASTQAEIVHSLSEKLSACYVFPELAEQVCLHLQRQFEAGKYAPLKKGNYLALALTMDMQEIAHDEHLWIRWHAETLPEDDRQLRFNPDWQAQRRLEAGQDNYGFRRLDWLPGQIGYLDIHYFHRAEWGRDTAIAALGFLTNAQSLIFDLRQCQGGYPDMLALVSSYLFGSQPVHLDSIYWRDEDRTQEVWTLPDVPGERFIYQPVYILIGKETFSAGEAFAYNLRALQRATLIGEGTGGGAHPGASYRIHRHFEAFIPIGRSINPTTGTNWEGCGVVPDISIPADQALELACKMALETIEIGA